MKQIVCVIVVLLCCRTGVSLSQTEHNILRAGLEISTVRQFLGEPDKITKREGAASESWYYGDSVIFIESERVIAWSDRGNLSKLIAVSGMEKKPTIDVDATAGWTNPWTPPELDSTKEEVVNKIVAE